MDRINQILEDKPLKTLFKLSLPAIVMSLMDELNSMIDAVFMGQYFGSQAVSSMSVVLPVMFFIIAMATMFSEGAGIAIGRYLGEKNQKKANEYFVNTVVITVIIGFVTGIICYLCLPFILDMFSITDKVKYFANVYLSIVALGMPVFMLVYVMAKMVYTEGHTKFLLYTTLVQLILNGLINFVLIGLLGFGVMGAALGTLLAQVIQITMLWRYINSDKMVMSFKLSFLNLTKGFIGEITKLGMPTFISMILLSITMGVEAKVIADFGSIPLSIQTITGYAFSISGSVAGAIMGVGLVMMSYAAGAGNKERFYKIIKISALSIFILMSVMNLLLIFNSGLVVKIFTGDINVIEQMALPALIYGLTSPFIFTTNVILYGMQPVGMENLSTGIFVLQQGILFMVFLFLFRPLGFIYAISAQPLAEVMGGLLTLLLMGYFKKKTDAYFDAKLMENIS